MCGRYSLIEDIQAICKRFHIVHPEVSWKARYNLAPMQEGLVITQDENRHFREARWGLLPHWSKTKEIKLSLINARFESLHEKPTFKGLLSRNRCLVPADGFYEWKESQTGKVPLRAVLKDRALFAFAGLWDLWQKEEQKIVSFTIITTTANSLIEPIHDRMPVILQKEAEDLWLDPSCQDWNKLQKILTPYPEQEMELYSVSKTVNSWKVDSPECIQKI